MQFIDTFLPLVICVREGALDDQELEQLAAGFERHFKRAEPYAVLNVSRVSAPTVDASARMQVAAWANQPRVQLASKALCAGSATVVARPWERHAMTALQWLWSPASPHQTVGTVAEGVTFCIARLVERDVGLPARPEAFEAGLSRALKALPIAGLTRESDPRRAATAASPAERPCELGMKTLSDADGSVVMGWVADSVLWARFAGHLSESLGAAYAAELERRLCCGTLIRYFVDASSLDSFDLMARTAAVGVLLANAHRLCSMLILNWSGGVSSVGRAVMATFGSAMKTTTHRAEFEARLLEEAPLAMQRIEEPAPGSLPRAPLSAR